jgi:hypothetical protein
MTVMTLMTVICGGFLSAGAAPQLAVVLSRELGDTVHPEAAVTGNFGNHHNCTASRQAEELVADYSPTAIRKIL